jgi:hypothetical protein
VDLPADVQVFLREAAELRDAKRRINPLTLDECEESTAAYQSIPIFAELGLIALDDASDSNPYCLITQGPAAGMIVHFCHDGDQEIRYPNLDAFLEALRAAGRRGLDIDQLPRETIASHSDQPQLADYLRTLFARDDDDVPTLVAIHLPLLDPQSLDLIGQAARHDDFLIREVAARFIATHPAVAHRGLAEGLARDQYPQVANPARRALRALGG